MVDSSPTPVTLLETLHGKSLVEKIRQIWNEEALECADKRKLEHFLSLRESSPQAPPCTSHNDDCLHHLFEILCKLVLYMPEVWFEAVTGCDRPGTATNDAVGMGAAFDASARLRRSGIDFYHERLAKRELAGHRCLLDKCIFYISADRVIKEPVTIERLPDPAAGVIRVVAVSDTHLLHQHLRMPCGDILVHAGDICYEESSSLDRAHLESYIQSKDLEDLKGLEFKAWFLESGLGLATFLEWFRDIPGFQHRVFIAGNHDYILEKLGKDVVSSLCEAYGVKYLMTDDAPLQLPLHAGQSVSVWGSPMSATSQLDAARTVLSGNTSFQVSVDEGHIFLRDSAHIAGQSVDIMMTHGPPEGVLRGKVGKTFPGIRQRIVEVQPSLYVCGHAHTLPDPLSERWADIDGVLCINAACVSNWNHFHGMPTVVDLLLRSSEKPACPGDPPESAA